MEIKKEYRFKYRLYWCNRVPEESDIARVTSTYTGIGGVSGMLETHKRKFVVNFKGPKMKKDIADGKITAEVSASEGRIAGQYLMYNPLIKGATVYMDFEPNNKTSELRIVLKKDGKNISEVWSYQWLP